MGTLETVERILTVASLAPLWNLSMPRLIASYGQHTSRLLIGAEDDLRPHLLH